MYGGDESINHGLSWGLLLVSSDKLCAESLIWCRAPASFRPYVPSHSHRSSPATNMAAVASTPAAPVMREGLVQVGDELLPRGLEPQELCDRVRASPSPFLLSPTSERLFLFQAVAGALPNPRRVW